VQMEAFGEIEIEKPTPQLESAKSEESPLTLTLSPGGGEAIASDAAQSRQPWN